MNVTEIRMPAEQAREELRQYLRLTAEQRTKEDVQIIQGLRWLAKGRNLLDLHQTMRAAGVDALGLPKLAIGRADWEFAYHQWDNAPVFYGGKAFKGYLDTQATTEIVRLPQDCFPRLIEPWRRFQALTPTIPPRHRPPHDLSNYWILWEAEWRAVAPKDPLLLKHISGPLYAILAAGDLTELERAVLAGRLRG